MQNIPFVQNNAPVVNSAEFVKLTIYNEYGNTSNGGIANIYTFSSAYKDEVISGTTYEALGGLLSVGQQPRDLRVTQADTSVALSGIDGNNIYIVLGTRIKGAKLEILRGFYGNSPGNLYTLQNTYQRFTGIVQSYNVTEDREGREDTFTVAINASSYKTVLENRIAGRKTNERSWQVFNSNDSSMNNVYSIADQAFDFGKDSKATKGTTTTTSASREEGSSALTDIERAGQDGG